MASRLCLLVFACGVITGCATTREIHRSALVPAIVPPLMTGEPIDNGLAHLSVSNATYLRAQSPREFSEASNSGLYIPRTQFALQALFRLGRDFSLGPKLEIGLNQGAQAIAEPIPPKPDGATVALGPAFQYSLPAAPNFRIGLGLEMLLAFSPYNKFTVTGGGYEDHESGVDSTMIIGMALMPCYRVGPVSFFAGVGGRNQPTITKHEIKSAADLSDGDDVRFGPMYFLAFGGLKLTLFRRLEATAEIYYPVSQEPVDYGGPALAVSLGVALGDPWRPRPVHRPAPTPPPPPPPAPLPAPAPAPAPTPGPEPVSPDEGPVEIHDR
jgi:hypothetical protein